MVLVKSGNEIVEKKSQVVRYGWFGFISDVTRINETFANETIVEAKKWNDLKAWFGFTGGNVSITITGYMRGRDKRRIKYYWEMLRNGQALLANLPLEIEDSKISVGQIILYGIVSLFFPFISDMCFQLSMVIKTMEFEDAPDHDDMYAYSITLEKLSWGVAQFIIDLLGSVVGLISLPDVSTMTTGLSALDLVRSNLSGADNPVGEVIDIESLPEEVQSSFDPGQTLLTITDVEQEFPSLPETYVVKLDIDRTLEWKKLPFLTSFPQAFSFDLGDHRYEMFWAVFDVLGDDDVIEYRLRLELKKDGEYVYYGKVTEQMQFIFDKSISIYVSQFTISQSIDNQILFSISGMVADND